MPNVPTLEDVVEGLVDLGARLVERDHLLDQHRTLEGERARLQTCPAEPCVTWRRMLALYHRWQAGRP